jgi:hypothetical protein
MSLTAEPLSRKHAGAYYTPPKVAHALVHWVVSAKEDRLLDPSCGDARFLGIHENAVGVERDGRTARQARLAAPKAAIVEADFFEWAATTHERFECAAGNPPFIRYQTFAGEARRKAFDLCRRLGANFTGLTSSWAPFLVAATGVLKLGGRMAFVVPAEIGHAPYATPLLEYLVARFRRVQIVAVRRKLFPDISEDCWLLYAEGFGGSATDIELSICDEFSPSVRPPTPTLAISLEEWRTVWGRRLRPLLMPLAARNLYQIAANDPGSFRLGDAASIGIGYVSGANDFFHLRPSTAAKLGITENFLTPAVRNGRSLPDGDLTDAHIARWRGSDEPMLLLRLNRGDVLPEAVSCYLASPAADQVKRGYKCRNRNPWWSVPDVRVPDYFLTYMSGRSPSLVKNSALATCANSLHALKVVDRERMSRVEAHWNRPLTQLSCEVEGHPLGGGMLKLEVREAARVLFASDAMAEMINDQAIEEALETMRAWRHYA